MDAPDPGARLHAIEEAARTRDQNAVPRLVSLLDSDDPAVRMLSIRTLEEITGQTQQYDYAAPYLERRAAIDRWNQWLVSQGLTPSTLPADGDLPLAFDPPQPASLPSAHPPSTE